MIWKVSLLLKLSCSIAEYDDENILAVNDIHKSRENKPKLRTKEMSVLQLKLTKLAIQIGYIGKKNNPFQI